MLTWAHPFSLDLPEDLQVYRPKLDGYFSFLVSHFLHKLHIGVISLNFPYVFLLILAALSKYTWHFHVHVAFQMWFPTLFSVLSLVRTVDACAYDVISQKSRVSHPLSPVIDTTVFLRLPSLWTSFSKILSGSLRLYRSAGKSLARPGRKHATATKTLTFASHSKRNPDRCPSNQVCAAAMTSASDEKWGPFNCFFSRVGLRTYQHPCTKPN